MNKVETYNRKNILSQIKWLIKMVRHLLKNTNGGGEGIQSIQAGNNITVDSTDPQNPIVSSTGGSDLTLEQARQNGNGFNGWVRFNGSAINTGIWFPAEVHEVGDRRINIKKDGDDNLLISNYPNTNDEKAIIAVNHDGSIGMTVNPDNLTDKEYTINDTGILSSTYTAPSTNNHYVQRQYVLDNFIAKPTEGSAGQVLTTDGAGSYTWEDIDVEVEEQQFVQITEGGKTGWGLKYRADNPDYYGDIGNNAIDLGYSENNSSITGATGDHSTVSGGFQNTASGNSSTVSGGLNNITTSYGEWVGGLYGTIPTGQSSTSWVATDRLFNIGNGTNAYSRSDAFTILKNGLATLPSVTNDLIDEEPTGKAVVTKEWVQDFYKTIPGYDEGQTQILKNINGVLTWVTDK